MNRLILLLAIGLDYGDMLPASRPVDRVALTNSCDCDQSGTCICDTSRCICPACVTHHRRGPVMELDKPTTITVPIRRAPTYRVLPSPYVTPQPSYRPQQTPGWVRPSPYQSYLPAPSMTYSSPCAGGNCQAPARVGFFRFAR